MTVASRLVARVVDTNPAKVLMLAVIVVAATVLVLEPVAGMALLALPFALFAGSTAAGRYLAVIVGSMVVFRGSDQLDAPKLVYLGLIVFCSLVATIRVIDDARAPGTLRPLFAASFSVGIALVLSLVVALTRDVPPLDWIRSAAPYGMLTVVPVLAWDGANSRLRHVIPQIALVVGLATSISFAVEWVGRRGLASLGVATLGAGSLMLAYLAFSVGVAAVLTRDRSRVPWAIGAALIIGILLATGTRSVLIVAAAPMGMLVVSRSRADRVRRLVPTVGAIGLVAAAILGIVFQSGVVDTAHLGDRLGSIFLLAQGLATDQSFQERQYQMALAVSAFESSPIVGVGLGHRYDVLRVSGQVTNAYTIDTGLVLLADLGLAGIVALSAAGTAMARWFCEHRRQFSDHAKLSAVGFGSILIAALPFGNPLDDKGLAVAVILLATWLIAGVAQVDAVPHGLRRSVERMGSIGS